MILTMARTATKALKSKKAVSTKPTPASVRKTTKTAKTTSFDQKIKNALSGQNLNNYWNNYKKDYRVWLAVLLLGLALLAVYKKSWFVAAMVNNSPLLNFELQQRLNSQYKQQVLSQMIDEQIILQEAKKRGVSASEQEVAEKITELEKNFGSGEVLDQLLAQQGQTRESLKQQLRFQVLIEKMYSDEATVSAEEVDSFITQNASRMQATESAEQKKEAEEMLKQQKLTQLFSQKFQELKQNSSIKIF